MNPIKSCCRSVQRFLLAGGLVTKLVCFVAITAVVLVSLPQRTFSQDEIFGNVVVGSNIYPNGGLTKIGDIELGQFFGAGAGRNPFFLLLILTHASPILAHQMLGLRRWRS